MNPGFDETASLIPDGHYKSIPDLVRKLNRCMTKEAQTKIKCSYVASKRIDIVTILGFEQDTVIEKETISPYVADMNGGFSSLYVYIYLFQTQNNLNNIIYEDNKEEVLLVSAVHEFKEVMVLGIFLKVLHALQFFW